MLVSRLLGIGSLIGIFLLVSGADERSGRKGCEEDTDCTTNVANAVGYCLVGACRHKCLPNFLSNKKRSACEPTRAPSADELSQRAKSLVPRADDCDGESPRFVLSDGITESWHNPASHPFGIRLLCGQLDRANFSVIAENITLRNTVYDRATDSIVVPGFDAGPLLLYVLGLDRTNAGAIDPSTNTTIEPALIAGTFQLLFGELNNVKIRTVNTVDVVNPRPLAGIPVMINDSLHYGVGMVGVSDDSGVIQLPNILPTTFSVRSSNPENGHYGVFGVGGFLGNETTDTYDMSIQLDPSIPLDSRSLLDRRQANNPPWDVSTSHTDVTMYTKQFWQPFPFTKQAYMRFHYETHEVPHNWFGTIYNDLFAVMMITTWGDVAFSQNSMNGMGAWAWYENGTGVDQTLTVPVPQSSDGAVMFVAATQNVADTLLQSSVVVTEWGDAGCLHCHDDDTHCSTCPADPTCTPICDINDVPGKFSCEWYRQCAEARMGCGPSGYPLEYGEHFCNKFIASFPQFSPAGRSWVSGVMQCLQKALLPTLRLCGATCGQVKQVAFDSHPNCYTNNGLCDLNVDDLGLILGIVAGDSVTYRSFWLSIKQGIIAGATCGPEIVLKVWFILQFQQRMDAIEAMRAQKGNEETDSALNRFKLFMHLWITFTDREETP